MKKFRFVLLACLLISSLAAPFAGASSKMTQFEDRVQTERPQWIPLARGSIELFSSGTFDFSVWRNAGGCMLVVFYGKLPDRIHPAIHNLHGVGGNNWIITDTWIGDGWTTVLTTFINSANLRKGSDVFKRESQAVGEVIGKMGGLGNVTHWELIRSTFP